MHTIWSKCSAVDLRAALSVGLLCFCASGGGTPENAPLYGRFAFADFLENYYQEGLRLFPVIATFAGDNRYNDLLHNDIGPEHRAKVKAYYTRHLNALGRYDGTELTEEEQTSYEVLKWEF
ncbi:MAG: hypothetical protein IIA65_09745, partial [Planctomycetes bacterium]|nr:hypothetical protein [Planctomycetota bacterium]